jgi:ketosteroid isomerase-like protein
MIGPRKGFVKTHRDGTLMLRFGVILLALLALLVFSTGCSGEVTTTTGATAATTATTVATMAAVSSTTVLIPAASITTTSVFADDEEQQAATQALAGPETLSLAPNDLAAFLEARTAAVNSGDWRAVAPFYSGGVLLELPHTGAQPRSTTGRDAMVSRLCNLVKEGGGKLTASGHPVSFGSYVIEPYSLGPSAMPCVVVDGMDGRGRIENTWVFTEPAGGPVRTPSTLGTSFPASPEAIARVKSQTLSLAGDDIVSMLRAREEAVNRGDGKAAAAFYAENGVLEELDVSPAQITTGRDALAVHLQELIDGPKLTIDQAGHPLQLGSYVFEPVFLNGNVSYILVYQVNERGEIEHQWVF